MQTQVEILKNAFTMIYILMHDIRLHLRNTIKYLFYFVYDKFYEFLECLISGNAIQNRNCILFSRQTALGRRKTINKFDDFVQLSTYSCDIRQIRYLIKLSIAHNRHLKEL